jgi:hypothetical protein
MANADGSEFSPAVVMTVMMPVLVMATAPVPSIMMTAPAAAHVMTVSAAVPMAALDLDRRAIRHGQWRNCEPGGSGYGHRQQCQTRQSQTFHAVFSPGRVIATPGTNAPQAGLFRYRLQHFGKKRQ